MPLWNKSTASNSGFSRRPGSFPDNGKAETSPENVLQVRLLGLVPYGQALELQQKRRGLRESNQCPDCLFLLEHPPTLTLGLRGDNRHILACDEVLNKRGVEVFQTDRGGDVTFHGPGQLVGYPVFHLGQRNLAVADYVRLLEEALIIALKGFNLKAARLPGYPGVWVDGRKIAAIGVKVSGQGVSTHGFAINVNTDLSFFDWIIPCGLKGKQVTSMKKELGYAPSMDDVADQLTKSFQDIF